MSTDPASGHYLGDKGRTYYAYQSQGSLQRGRINARKFAAFIRPEHTVLDFGCGDGALLLHLDCCRRIGVEINPAARAEASQRGLETYAALADIPTGGVDVAISNHALEHVLCPLETLRGLREKLVVGGRLVLCLPFDDWRTQPRFDPQDINHHLYTWTPLLLGHLLTEAGFRVERTWVYTHAWPPQRWELLDRWLPVRLFDLVCAITAWRYQRRQVMAVAAT